MVQMLGWLSADAAWASRWKRLRACGSRATSSGRNLRATKRCSRMSSACIQHPCLHHRASRQRDNAKWSCLLVVKEWPLAKMVGAVADGVNEDCTAETSRQRDGLQPP